MMMMNRNGQGYVQPGWTSQSQTSYGRPQPADVQQPENELEGGLEGELDVDLEDINSADWQQRAHTRQIIREFLRAVPRSETETALVIVRPDGEQRLLTRAQLSTAIDRLRPRQRQIVRLALEERWPRQRVCEYLHNISIKTLERDQVEALDILAEL
jgi:DNA-directed RNA polymerase specialized sigma24 family protein